MCLDPGALELLDYETPARGGFQRECRLLVGRKAREPMAQMLAGGGGDLAAFDLAGLDLYVVEGYLLPMHVQSTYNVHPGPPQAPSLTTNALMISRSSAFELRRLLSMSPFDLSSSVPLHCAVARSLHRCPFPRRYLQRALRQLFKHPVEPPGDLVGL